MGSSDTLGRDHPDDVDHDTVPPARTGLLVVAGILLALPVVALMWVSSYSRDEPRLGGFPFFIWYQFLWVFLCSGMTYAAYRIVLVARPHRPMTGGAAGGATDRTTDHTADRTTDHTADRADGHQGTDTMGERA